MDKKLFNIKAKLFIEGNFGLVKCPHCGAFTSVLSTFKCCRDCNVKWIKKYGQFYFKENK